MLKVIMNNLTGLIFSTLVFLLTLIYKRICAYKNKLDITQNGLKAILKIKILEFYDKVMINKYITIYEKEIFIDLCNEYRALGGNGIIEDIIKDVNQLELKVN
ncbi:MAG: hypothetical protein RR359_04090 [Bacilli bacterium]